MDSILPRKILFCDLIVRRYFMIRIEADIIE